MNFNNVIYDNNMIKFKYNTTIIKIDLTHSLTHLFIV